MYSHQLQLQINEKLADKQLSVADKDNAFYSRLIANASSIESLYKELYSNHPTQSSLFSELLNTLINAYTNRAVLLKQRDRTKLDKGYWFLNNDITGMSLYVDRFAGNLKGVSEKLDYFKKLGVNLLHLMPIFESPAGESDGGYAVSDFRKVDARFGNLEELRALRHKMNQEELYLMLDIVLNHTSQKHEWALRAKNGEKKYQDYFYMYDDRKVPDAFDRTMPDIFPESSPGNFTFVPECNKWVMTVFHHYQWDLNYSNPAVLVEMLDTIFFYANLGVDILRIDAPAFIWKQLGTTSQNLPEAHTILRLIKLCVQTATPGMALLGEAIVAPVEIMKYFGTGNYTAKECDLAYNATQMALQWDALASGDTRVMIAAQHEILQKPYGTSWITYTRCHDDIGLGYEDYMIQQAGYEPYAHRKFLQNFYSGNFIGSPASGALFSVNPKTQDARISGSLASLCGLEKALEKKDETWIDYSIRKILLMQAQSFLIGGIPMIFYGDELGYTNDYSYLADPGKSYDNRWMHRPVIDWNKNSRAEIQGTLEEIIFSGTRKLISIRKKLAVVADSKNLFWLDTRNRHLAAFMRSNHSKNLYCIFNFSTYKTNFPWSALHLYGNKPKRLYDHWKEEEMEAGHDNTDLLLEPYNFLILEAIE